jgi:hypothetical protein
MEFMGHLELVVQKTLSMLTLTVEAHFKVPGKQLPSG